MLLGLTLVAHGPAIHAVIAFDSMAELKMVPELDSVGDVKKVVTGARPVSRLTFAVNRTLHGFSGPGYHAVNLAIHAINSVLLMILAGRLLRRAGQTAPAAKFMAFAIAALWVVHPLTTSAVAYTIQRDEVLMTTFYLLTLWAAARGMVEAETPASETTQRAVLWWLLAVVVAALGMATKQVMMTVPAVVLLMDRCFYAHSFKAALRRRWGGYLGLAATWGVLWHQRLFEVVVAEGSSVGFATRGATPWEYLMTQPAVIFHYLRLTFWPHPLVLDYHWMPVTQFSQVAGFWLVLGLLGLLTLVALWRRPAVGFVAMAAWIVLSPTSSFVPTADLAFEHRFYLPLACVIALVVVAVARRLRRVSPHGRAIAAGLLAGLVVTASAVSFRRSQVYGDRVTLWKSVVEAADHNARAMHNLGSALWDRGEYGRALGWYQQAVDRWPTWAVRQAELGERYMMVGQPRRAAELFKTARDLEPAEADYHKALVLARLAAGQIMPARQALDEMARRWPDSPAVKALRRQLQAAEEVSSSTSPSS
ncbi:MAG: tetratricopeptide repeat protein [Phycisphaeraceae bacterium]|nr:tetratricopeptide repeat protein [Phycisphaeraceae bacterium]